MSHAPPGPWGVDIDNENLDRIEVVYRGEDSSQLEHIAEIYFSIPNAHLISAAPELLAACKMAIIEMSKGHGLSIHDREVIRSELNAAIAKAEGRGKL